MKASAVYAFMLNHYSMKPSVVYAFIKRKTELEILLIASVSLDELRTGALGSALTERV